MATFLLEVGTEELPASFISEALDQWRSRIIADLEEQFLVPQKVRFYGTPRRLAMILEGLPDRQPDRQEEVKGPPAKAAFKNGAPTKAAEGFARSRGASVQDLEVRDTGKGAFVFVSQSIQGQKAAMVLAELAPKWILGLEGKRFMRWGDGDLRFPRPIRWLTALLDEEVLPVTLESGSMRCVSDRSTQGHRVLHPQTISLKHPNDYAKALRQAFVEVDPATRRQVIRQQVIAAAEKVSGVPVISEELLAEVANLVEWPTAVVGRFDEIFLALPAEVAVMEMESHQRYFPVRSSDGSETLLPYFITISNGDPAKSAIIAEGNGRVIRARLSDGKFFFDADRAQPLEAFVEKLEAVTFEERLGSMRAKVDRIKSISLHLADQLQLDPETCQQVQRAALLCKADLVSQMVGEFPELQGVMGQTYALHSGESDAVATGIFEHYLPRGAEDALPQSMVGQVVGIADRLDTLVCIFSLGMLPSGSSDPFALRRAANAIVNITWAAGLPLNLEQCLHQVIQDFTLDPHIPINDAGVLEKQLSDFFFQRLRSLLQDELHIDYDLVNAVLGEDDAEYRIRAFTDLLDVRERACFLQGIRADGGLNRVYATVNRAARLAAQGDLDLQTLNPVEVIDPGLLKQASEEAFYEALLTLLPQTEGARTKRDYHALLSGLEQAAPVVSRFFDGEDSVLVMDEDKAVRRNRLGLLGLLRNHARVLADFGAIVKSES